MKKNSWYASVVLVLITVTAVACGKKNNDNGGSGNNPPYYPGGCVNGICQGGGTGNLLSNVQFQAGSSFAGAISLSAVNGTGQFNFSDPKVAVYYQGQVVINGQLQVQTQDYYLCGAQVGTYSITTVQPGQYSMGVMAGLHLQANGPSRIELVSTGPSILFNSSGSGLDQNSPANRVNLRMMAIVNGQPCGEIVTN